MSECAHPNSPITLIDSRPQAANNVTHSSAGNVINNVIGNGCLDYPYVIAHGGGCAIYDNRPLLCRLYGTVSSMPCPHGAGPEKMLSIAEERDLMRDYTRLISDR